MWLRFECKVASFDDLGCVEPLGRRINELEELQKLLVDAEAYGCVSVILFEYW